jgi:predicted aconitase with swiveling domain
VAVSAARPPQVLAGRVIYAGEAAGTALVSPAPISFYGGVDLATGTVSEAGHPLEGQPLAGRVLVFPTGKGSTVGSYALLRLARTGLGPAALVMASCDTTVAVGAIIAEIPCVDLLDLEGIRAGDRVEIRGEEVRVG